jgi:two-component system cell cycle sensor histidine kinase PleC
MIKDQFFGNIEDASHKQKYLSAAQDIHNVAQDMLELLEDLMDISCGDDFKIKLEDLTISDIEQLAKRAIRLNRDFAIRKNIEIILTCQTENLSKDHLAKTNKLKIKLDSRRIKQILINLISNSVKYSQPGTKIIVNIAQINNRLAIDIKDQGIGMNEEQIKMALGGKGMQIDKSIVANNQNQINSHGIGVPLVKRLVELQQGEMQINSVPKKGTQIVLNFNY